MLLRLVNVDLATDVPLETPNDAFLAEARTPALTERRVIRACYYTRNRPNVGKQGPAPAGECRRAGARRANPHPQTAEVHFGDGRAASAGSGGSEEGQLVADDAT
ncbi:hypothetical protein GCM10009681_20690 [Luedemannella helvata]|uniref:Uncharacterized protein n=1 Tax=Luedemannella helvata TaxID=349315 RepID=A0ABN2K6K1_9ACTN